MPLPFLFWFGATSLFRWRGANSAATPFGAAYLQAASLALVFECLTSIAGRVLVGVNDTITSRYVRTGGAFANITPNWIRMFGLRMGVVGAAPGTVVATVLITAVFVLGFLGWNVPLAGSFPLHLDVERP